MKNILIKTLLGLATLALLNGVAAAQSSSDDSQPKKKVRSYLPTDLDKKVDRVQDDDDDDPPPPPKRRPRPRPPVDTDDDSPRASYPRQPQPARACYTNFGACQMRVALPQGSSCTCVTTAGYFPGIAQ